MNNKLLIIDSSIKDINIILNSLQTTTYYIIIDYINDTYDSLLYKINNLNINSFNYIGIIKEEYYGQYYNFISSDQPILQNVESLDSWVNFINFFNTLKNTYNFTELDFISCKLASYPEYIYIFNNLETVINITIGASTDLVGNLVYGGNWIMETTNVDVQLIYFNDNILNYVNLLGITTTITLSLSSSEIIYGSDIIITPSLTGLDVTSANNGTFTITDNLGNIYLSVTSNTIPVTVTIIKPIVTISSFIGTFTSSNTVNFNSSSGSSSAWPSIMMTLVLSPT